MGSWPELTFKDAPFEIIDGDRGVNYPKQSDFLPIGHCVFLNARNVTAYGFIFSEVSFVSRERNLLLRKGKLEFQDIVLTTRGTVGNVGFYDESVNFDHVRINSGMVILRPDQSRIAPRFLYLFLRSHLFKAQVTALATGSAQPQLPIRDIRRIQISLPTMTEQLAIAETLGALDDKIEMNRRMNETLEAMARAIFKDWFVDFGPTRAKAEGRVPYLAPELWDLFPDAIDDEDKPDSWKQGGLADVANSPRRGVSPANVAEDTPYIGLEHMPRRSVALTEWEGAGKVTSNKSAFKKGEFLFGKLRPYFHKVGLAPSDGICSTDIVVVSSRASDWAAFTLACLSSDEFVDYTDQTSTGTKMPRTSWKTMGQYKIWLPSDKVARAFQSLAQPLLDCLSANVHEIRTLAKTRDLLLPKLMSGEIRLQEAEKTVEAVA